MTIDPEKHRCFYVDDVLRYALYYDKNITDPKVIVDNFIASKDWREYSELWQVKPYKFKVSPDLKRVDIVTVPLDSKKPTKKKEKEEMANKDWQPRKVVLEIHEGDKIVYTDSAMAETKAEFEVVKKNLSATDARKEFAAKNKGKKLIYKYRTEKSN